VQHIRLAEDRLADWRQRGQVVGKHKG
jgi:hypothetical protein